MLVARTYYQRLKFVKPFLNGILRPTILEIGAALGFGLPVAQDLLNANVLACDISQEAVTACKKAGFQTYLADAYGTCQEIAPNSLDMVFAFDLIEHLPDIKRFKEWLMNVLKPGGIFFVVVLNMNHVINKILGSRSTSIKIPQHTTYFTTSTLKNALKNGFSLETHSWDYQYVSFSIVISCLAHIVGLPPLKRNFGPTIYMPNGLLRYVFRKIDELS